MDNGSDNSVRFSAEGAWPQYAGAFAMAVGLNVWWTTMPFILSGMGGTEIHVGYAPAANGIGYICGLLVAGSLLHNLNVKRATRAAAAVGLLAAIFVCLAIYQAQTCNRFGPLCLPVGRQERGWIWIIIASGAIAGAAMAFYWPFLMSWVSGGYEGERLNRRFGRYNGSWSAGGLIGPLIGAPLVEINLLLPMIAAAVCIGFSCLVLGRGRIDTSKAVQVTHASINSGSAHHNPGLLLSFRWMARIGMFSAWACLAAVRSQFALLFVNLGFSEAQFGLLLTVFSTCNFLVLTAAGRSVFWHFRPNLLFAAQVLLILAVLLFVYGSHLATLMLAAVVLGCAFGFTYSSHLYYGASNSIRRSTQMAIHEITISLGTTIGSAAGGILCKHVGLYWPYWFTIALLCLGLAGQLMVYIASRRTKV